MYSLHQLLQVKRNNQCPSPRGCWVRQKVSCILHHRDPQLRLAYSWARPIGLAAGKGRGGMFLFLVSSLSFIFLFLPCPSHSSPLLSLFSLSQGDDIKWPTRIDVSFNPNTVNLPIPTSLGGINHDLSNTRIYVKKNVSFWAKKVLIFSQRHMVDTP